MFNNQQFNQLTFNSAMPTVLEVLDWEIVYNGYVLHETDDIRASFSGQWNWPKVKAETFDIPWSDWIVLTNYKFRERVLPIRWTISKATELELVEEMENMKRFLCEPNQTLQVYIGWEPRRATAFLINPDDLFERQHYNIDRQPFTAIFQITDPFWEEVGTNSVTYESLTSTLQEEVVNSWTTKTKPILILSFETAAVTEIEFTMWSKTITITRSITDSTIVIVDWTSTRPVTVNDVPVDFDWSIPDIEIWNNPYTVTITWTFDVTVTMQRKKRFI